MTRLFSRDDDEEKRRLLFNRGEMIGHIRTLYANWTSVSILFRGRTAEFAEAAAAKFNGKAAEAETALDFDSLLESGFFEHLQSLKESIGEVFLCARGDGSRDRLQRTHRKQVYPTDLG